MTASTRVSDERLAELIASREKDGLRGTRGWNDLLCALRELRERRALLKECDKYMIHRHECDEVPCTCGLDSLLSRIRALEAGT